MTPPEHQSTHEWFQARYQDAIEILAELEKRLEDAKSLESTFFGLTTCFEKVYVWWNFLHTRVSTNARIKRPDVLTMRQQLLAYGRVQSEVSRSKLLRFLHLRLDMLGSWQGSPSLMRG
jgi:hypothetical protein